MLNQTRLGRRSVLLAGATGALTCSVGAYGPRAAAAPRPVRPVMNRDIFVDPRKGDDRKKGTNPGQAVRTLYAALALLQQKSINTPAVNVWLRQGSHLLDKPLEISGLAGDFPVTWRSYPGEHAEITGSRALQQWRQTTVNGVRAWQTTVPLLDGKRWEFRSLFVNQERRSRPRLPESVDDFLDTFEPVTDLETQNYWFQKGTSDAEPLKFVYREGDLNPAWENLTDIDVVATTQWITERGPLASIDASTRTATLQHRPITKMWVGRHYYLDNVKDALRKPGQWYLDRLTRTVTYLPKEGESLASAQIMAPVAEVMIDIRGTADTPVANQSFTDLTIGWNDWDYYVNVPYDLSDQAANLTRGAVEVRHARGVSFTNVTFTNNGERALEVGRDARDIALRRCTVKSAGSGALKIGSERLNPEWGKNATSDIEVSDCHVHHLGEVFHNAAGVHIGDVSRLNFVHNHVHDVIYSPVSLGWNWDYTETGSSDNVIAHNHIHDAGKNYIYDLAGVYNLGVQRGGRIQHNHIHHILGEKSPSCGIYLDQGSAMLTISDNWVHHNRQGIWAPNSSAGLDVVNNVVSENSGFQIGATGGYEAIGLGGLSTYKMSIHRNIVTAVHQPLFGSPGDTIRSDNNLLWDFAKPLTESGNVPLMIKLVRAGDLEVVATAVVDKPAGSGQDFIYADLPSPVTLDPKERYHLSMVVESGGLTWHDAGPITTTDAARVLGYSFFGWEGDYITDESGRVSFGPVSFKYRDATGVHEFVTSQRPETGMRNNYGGQLGFWFETGSEPLVITALGTYPLGLWYAPWHAAGLDAHSVLADPQYIDRPNDDYRVDPSSPALKPPVNYAPVGSRFGIR